MGGGAAGYPGGNIRVNDVYHFAKVFEVRFQENAPALSSVQSIRAVVSFSQVQQPNHLPSANGTNQAEYLGRVRGKGWLIRG